MIGREMRRESIREPQFGSQHRAEMARSEDIERHFGSRRRDRLDALIRNGRRQERLELHNVLGKGLRGLRRATQGVQRELIRAWRTAEPEIDTAGKEPLQRSELLGDDVGRMVRKHDAACPDPNGRRPLGDVSKHDRCRGAGNASHVVMLGHPDAPVAQFLGVSGEVASVVERAASVSLLRDANELEDGQGGHEMLGWRARTLDGANTSSGHRHIELEGLELSNRSKSLDRPLMEERSEASRKASRNGCDSIRQSFFSRTITSIAATRMPSGAGMSNFGRNSSGISDSSSVSSR